MIAQEVVRRLGAPGSRDVAAVPDAMTVPAVDVGCGSTNATINAVGYRIAVLRICLSLPGVEATPQV
jgi:hypothetical protein